MFEMNRTQSHLVDMFSIGKSYEGRPLYVLQVGERARDTRENKATCRLRQHSKYPACLLSDRKEKSPSEESRVDRLRRPRQRVDRTCLLPVVRQRGSVVIVSCDIEPLFDHSVSIAVCNDWSLVSPTKPTSVHICHVQLRKYLRTPFIVQMLSITQTFTQVPSCP